SRHGKLVDRIVPCARGKQRIEFDSGAPNAIETFTGSTRDTSWSVDVHEVHSGAQDAIEVFTASTRDGSRSIRVHPGALKRDTSLGGLTRRALVGDMPKGADNLRGIGAPPSSELMPPLPQRHENRGATRAQALSYYGCSGERPFVRPHNRAGRR